nr:pectinesterase-like [Tanacetum cinerariifolium]
MAFDRGKKKKITVLAIVTILLGAAVVGTYMKVKTTKERAEIDLHKAGGMKTGLGLIVAGVVGVGTVIFLCKYTDFREICRETLDRIRTRIKEPREFIKATFHVAIERIQVVIEKTITLKKTTTDTRAVIALDQCNELLTISIEDLKRSIERVNLFDFPKLKDNTVELKVWLSGAVTYQQTCLDAFDNTTGDTRTTMTKLLDIGTKLTRNSLAMIDGVIELSASVNPGNIRPVIPQPGPSTTVVDWKIDQPDVPQPKPKNIIVDWRNNRPEVPQPKPKNVIVDWKVDHNNEVPQPKPKNVIVDWRVDHTTDVPQPKPKNVVIDTKVDHTTEVPKPKPKSIDVDWQTDVTITRRTDGSRIVEKPNAGNRRMLDQMSKDDHEQGFHSKLQMVGDTRNDDIDPTPQSKPTMLHETSTPSWAEGSRRSLINVDPASVKPNAVVAQDGSGNFKTITEAVNTAPQRSTDPFIILIKAGPTKTKITGNKNFIDGTSTYHTATVAVNGDGFIAKDIGFENSAGPDKHQAVALRVSADMTIFHNCVMEGHQDTLYTHSYRQFYRQCVISGTIDFIFGNAAAVFQDCKMIVRKPLSNQAGMVTAQGRKDQHSVGGLVLDGCTITAEPEYMNAVPMPKSYLGRPWKEFSRTIIMHSFLDKNIDPEGWAPWTGTFALDTCYYAELNNKGPGADTGKRVTWKGIKKISQQEAQAFSPGVYIQGDSWIKATNVPYESGLMRV